MPPPMAPELTRITSTPRARSRATCETSWAIWGRSSRPSGVVRMPVPSFTTQRCRAFCVFLEIVFAIRIE